MTTKNELGFQKEICDSAKFQGGRARKLSHRFSVGVPDILVSIPGYFPSLI